MLERKFPERYAKVDRLRVSGDEQNNTPVKVSDEDAKTRLLKKLAAIAEKNLERLGKSDEPEVVQGVGDEDGLVVEESLSRKKSDAGE